MKEILSFVFLFNKRRCSKSVLLLLVPKEALVPLGNSIVDNPVIQSRPHTRLHSSHIVASEQSRFESCRLYSECDAKASLTCCNRCKRSQAAFVGCEGESGLEDYQLFRKLNIWQITFKHAYLFSYWIKCYVLESYCWLNSLNVQKVLEWYDQEWAIYDINSLAYFLLNHRV